MESENRETEILRKNQKKKSAGEQKHCDINEECLRWAH